MPDLGVTRCYKRRQSLCCILKHCDNSWCQSTHISCCNFCI